MRGKRSRASRCIRPVRERARRAARHPRASWRRAGATARACSIASAILRARGRPGLMRSTLWRSLPSARSRGARPSSTQASTAGTIVSRNDSESAACTRSASGQPPSSCTCTSPAVMRTRSSPAPRSRRPAATISAQRSWCQRLYSGESQRDRAVPARGRVRVGALDVVRGSRDPRRLGRVRVELEQPVQRALEMERVRMDLVHPRPARLEQLAHSTVTGLACST